MTYLPGFERYVVTMSEDTPEIHGYEDLAIGHFSADANVKDAVKEVLLSWWAVCSPGLDPELAWVHLLNEGLIDCATAWTWRYDLWGSDEDDEE